MTLLSISIPVLKVMVLLWLDSGKVCVAPPCKDITSFWVEFPKPGRIWSRREEHIAFKASLFWGIDRRLIWWLVKALFGPVTLKQMIIRTLAHFAFLCFSWPWFFSPWRLVMGMLVLHRCLRQTRCPPIFEHYLILFWLTPTDWLWIRQPPYPLVSAVKGQPWLRVFFKAFQNNYNSLSLIKLVPPQHSVMFFLATPWFEEFLVVLPQRNIPFCLIMAGQSISTSVAALRQNGAGRNQRSGVEEITPPPKSLDCDPGLWFGGKTKSLIPETFLVATDLEYYCCCSEFLKIASFFYLNLCSCTVLAFCLVTLFSEFQSAGCAVGSVRLIGG